MVKIFQTGDNHFGKRYDNFPQIRERLIRSRFEALQRCVAFADRNGCDFFVVTGDLFDNTNRIPRRTVREAVRILGSFSGTQVLVLPGNHDFCTGEEKVWADFCEEVSDGGYAITLLREQRPYVFEAEDGTAVFYPAPCDAKHSAVNTLGWIREADLTGDYRIGVAHGALEKLSPDLKNEYFPMTEKELSAIAVDAWLIGHTHIPYPQLPEDADLSGYRIFNAGTHEQTDVSNNTPGYGFLLTLTREGGKNKVLARAYRSGGVFYPLRQVTAAPGALETAICQATEDLEETSVVRLVLRGSVTAEEYRGRKQLYDTLLSRFLTWEVLDGELCEEITPERIRDAFPEVSLAAKLLLELLEDPVEARMAYELLEECRS